MTSIARRTKSEEEFNKWRESNGFEELDFRNVNLDGLIPRFGKYDLRNVDLSGATLHSSFENVIFEDAKLIGADCRRTTFERCTFEGTDVSRADFYEAKFENCDFTGCLARRASQY